MFLRALGRFVSAFDKATTFQGKIALFVLASLLCFFLWTLLSSPFVPSLVALFVLAVILLGVAQNSREEKRRATEESERTRHDEIQIRKAEAQRQEVEAKRREEEARFEQQYSEWVRNHIDMIGKFMLIAERKVSVLDEYGDENWDALDKEIQSVTKKIAKLDGFNLESRFPRSSSSVRYDSGTYWRMLHRLRTELSDNFRKYHFENKSRLQSGIAPDFDRMDGVEFEVLIARLLISDGYEVGGTPTTGDQGADLIATKKGRTIAIQAKRHAAPVGNSAIQEIVAALRFYKADEGWVVTNSSFTSSAEELAKANGVRLVDGIELRRLLGQRQNSS